MSDAPLDRLRAICLALPKAVEVEAWGTSTFRCGKIFAMYSHADDVVHSGGRPGVWLKAGPGNQALMVRDRPDRFFVPPYVGKAGWIGVRLDRRPPWGEIALLVEESWRLIAPKKLLAVQAASPGARGIAAPASKSAAQRKPKRASKASQAAATPRSARTTADTRAPASRKDASSSKRRSSSATRRAR